MLLVLAVVGVAVVGAWQAIATLASPSLHGGGGSPTAAGAEGERVETSFGYLTVQQTHVLDGLSASDVGGMTHGIQNFVPSDQAQIELNVRIDNDTGDEVRVDQRDFHLAATGSPAAAPRAGAVRSLSLPAGTSGEVTLTFVVPRAGRQMTLLYKDPGSAREIGIAVGPTDRAPAGAASHDH